MPDPTPYDRENKDDGEDYYKRVGSIKLEWDGDVHFWFNSIEASLRRAQVFKQWTKREVLMELLPPNVLSHVKYLYRLDETEAGATPYYDIKQKLIKVFAPKPQDSMDKALSLVLKGLPSELGNELIEILCKCKPVLNSQCCADHVFGLFRRQMPTAVRNMIANKSFTKDNYEEIFTLADSVFLSNKPDASGAVAAVRAPTPKPDTSGDAIAAVGPNRGGRGGRGGRGRGNWNNRGNGGGSGRGGSNSNQNQNSSNQNQNGLKGPRHSDSPPTTVCQIHWTFGKGASYCRKPRSCPWKDFTTD